MKNFLKDNLKAKVICILFAFTMWIYVMSDVNPVITSEYRDIPVTISNMKDIKDAELVLAPETKLLTRVSIKGRRTSVSEVDRTGFKVYGIITEPKEGSNVLKLSANIENPNVDYMLVPDNLNVKLEQDLLKQKPVVVERQGSLEKNFEIESIKTNPSNIYVEGPKSLVDKVVSVRTALDITGNNKDFSKKLQITAVDKDGNAVNGVKLSEDSIFVHATVLETKKVPIQVKISGQEQGDRRLSGYTVNPSEITIKGPSLNIQSITEIFTQDIDVNELLKTSNYTTKINLPDKIKSQINQVTVETTSEKLITKEFDISKDRIKLIGNGQLANISDNDKVPAFIKVKIVFSDQNGQNITSDDVSLYINMQDIQNNPAKVPIKAEVTKVYESIEITPSEIDLKEQ